MFQIFIFYNLENEKLDAIKNDLISKLKHNLKEAFVEYIRDENSKEAYYALEESIALVYAFKGLLKRHFIQSGLQIIFDSIKVDVLKSGNEYCDEEEIELTEDHLKTIDYWLR